MKRLYLSLFLAIFLVKLSHAQIDAANNTTAIGLGATSTDPNYKFTYGSYSIAHYGLGWYGEPVNTSPIGYLSGFAGFKFFTEGSPRVTITGDGNVGIGTTIDLVGWPDYVFKNDYKLMPLRQVKSYIAQNQHLPGMPTDKEIENKGLDVGEMNKLLTKKVEELTLYLIEKDKEINDQKEINKQQQATNQSLEQKFDRLASQLDMLTKKQIQ